MGSRGVATDLPPSEPGKCYAKCTISPPGMMDTLAILPIYNGDHPADFQMNEFVISEEKKGTRWVKKPSMNCQSADPNDCLVWCLEEVNIERKTINYLSDVSTTEDYELTPIIAKNPDAQNGPLEWREVVCQNQIDRLLIEQIKMGLAEKGYLNQSQKDRKVNDQLENWIKTALVKYQRENALPVGQLDVETLTSLNIRF